MIPRFIFTDCFLMAAYTATSHIFMRLLEMAKRYELKKVYVHCFLDGRDTPPESGKDYVTGTDR